MEHLFIIKNEEIDNIDYTCHDYEYIKDFLYDIILNVIENRDKFDGKEISLVKNYINKSLKNKIRNLRKKEKIQERSQHQITDYLYSKDEDNEDKDNEDEFMSQYLNIISVLDKLSPDEHKLLDMHYSDGMTLKEIAVYLNETESAIKQRHKRLKAKIRLLLNVPPPANIMPIKDEKNNVTFFLEIVLYIKSSDKIEKSFLYYS